MEGSKICVKPLSIKNIRKITKMLREVLNIEDDERFPIVHFIEWVLGDPDSDFDYEITEVEEMQDIYGLTDTNRNVMKIRGDVYKGAIEGNPRDVFTLCHELGHYLLHKPEAVEFARVSENIPAFRNPEWQANTFAAELLAPYDRAKNMSAKEIAEQYGMSAQAAQIRCKQCRG